MQVSVQERRSAEAEPDRLVLVASDPAGPLVHEAHVGAGVRVGVDLLAPGRWLSVSVGEVGEANRAVLAALLGERAVQDLTAPDGPPPTLETDDRGADTWLRVAVVDAVDRWLHLPLDQALIEAERGISRAHAALALPPGPARDSVLADALRLARGASSGLVRLIRRLGTTGAALPDVLRTGLDQLVTGYGELATQVRGPDRELRGVPDAWSAVLARTAAASTVAPREAPRGATRRAAVPDVTSVIDPRQVPARLLGLSGDPAVAEVGLSAGSGGSLVHVRVPAFRGPVDEDRARRLLVRLVDRRTAESRAHGLLTLSSTRRQAVHRRYFGATVPVPAAEVADLRADVYDALSPLPPAPDGDAALREARRASVFLREWRRIVAAAWVTTTSSDPAGHLRDLAERIRPRDGDVDRPVLRGGPSARELLQLADAGEDDLLQQLRGAGAEPDGGPLDSVGGLGRLLVAEIAAAVVCDRQP